MLYAVEMVSCGMTYFPSFMKTGEGLQAIVKVFFRNLRGNIGVAGGRNLLVTSLM
jgi:hypothetical protein